MKHKYYYTVHNYSDNKEIFHSTRRDEAFLWKSPHQYIIRTDLLMEDCAAKYKYYL